METILEEFVFADATAYKQERFLRNFAFMKK